MKNKSTNLWIGMGIGVAATLLILFVFSIVPDKQPSTKIYSVNIVSIDRLPQLSCESCLNSPIGDCVDNLMVNYNINSNAKDTVVCRSYYKDSKGREQDSPNSADFEKIYNVAYNGANQETLITDLKEEYSVQICCWTDVSNADEDIGKVCSEPHRSFKACWSNQ